MTRTSLSGSCLCGDVRFVIHAPFREVIVCHCRQCARWTGSTVAATAVAPDNFELVSSASHLKWYASSDHASRGFCDQCGSSLFWKPCDGSRISILAGTLEPPTGLKVIAHIFVASKSDYYTLADGVKQFERGAGAEGDIPGTGR